MTNTKKALTGASLAATVAMALAGCGNSAMPDPKSADAMPGKVSCKESNSCKGNGSCAGVAVNEKHACKGQNSCGGNVREITKTECDALKGTVVAAK